MPNLLRLAPVVLSIMLAGCTALGPYQYNVLCRNRSNAKLNGLRISYGNFSTQFGSHLRVTEPLASEVHVQFSTEDGQTHRRRVHIPEDIRRNVRSSDLMFLIEPDLSVTVRLRTREERRAEAGL